MILGRFHLDGDPVPKARARTYVALSGSVRTVTPGRTVAYERDIAWAWNQATSERRFEGAVKITIRVVEASSHPGDLDNYVKSVLDGLNGVAWVDDVQVIAIDAGIIRHDERPGLDVVVEGWDHQVSRMDTSAIAQ